MHYKGKGRGRGKGKKVLLIPGLLILLFLLSGTLKTAAASDKSAEAAKTPVPPIIYETSSKETITSGATLERITRFTTGGWLRINVIRADITNPQIKIDTMSNPDSLKQLTTVKTLAESRGAVAAINAGFFNWVRDATGVWGYPDGPLIESGKLISIDSIFNLYNDSMSSISINKNNQISYDYWKGRILLFSPAFTFISVNQYNKPGSDYKDFTIIDRRWSLLSIGASEAMPDIAEMVVDNDKVIEIRQAQPAAPIPENGYVVVTRQDGAKLLKSIFSIGDTVRLEMETLPDWKNLNMSVAGSSVIVREGAVPEKFSVNTQNNSLSPRTAIGSNKSGSQLIMAAVDGRQDGSIGMTLASMARLMIELGAWNALSLDGGGSTTVVSRKPGTNILELVNSPSDGLPRRISTAVGIFSNAAPATLSGLKIDTEDRNVFVGTSREFSVRGWDKYNNPVEILPDQVKWSVSGVRGNFSGNTFLPETVGEGQIKASIGTVSAIINISVLSSPAVLSFKTSDKQLNLPVQKSIPLSVDGKNRNGFHAIINPMDIKWSVSEELGTFEGNVFTATNPGTGYIKASIGETNAYLALCTAVENSLITDDFEILNGTFASYPGELPGDYELSEEQKHTGNFAGKLTYDFSNIEGSRAAYVVFSNGGITLEDKTDKIGIWVYNDHISSNWLSAEILDSGGKINRLYFAKNLDWTGWKYLELPVAGLAKPLKLAKLYLVQTSPVSDAGFIYLDDLTQASTVFYQSDPAKLPQNTIPKDFSEKSTVYKKSSDSLQFSVFGQSDKPLSSVNQIIYGKLTEKINKYYDLAAFVGNNSQKSAGSVKKPLISANKGYIYKDMKNSRFIQLDMSKGGLRLSSPGQWDWFLKLLETAKGNSIRNVFIFLSDSPAAFTDPLEANLFQDILTSYKLKTGKNIWVFYKNNINSSYMERGIKYIATAGFNEAGLSKKNTGLAKFVLVTVKGSTVTYEFKPVE